MGKRRYRVAQAGVGLSKAIDPDLAHRYDAAAE